ncbi:MAG: GcvT family protein [Rhodospirillaceae bacterium]|nr:GcvT family protein [Rhodospirillaceae bacterium]
MPEALPAHARVVVIGGGVAGCSALYHLALKGWNDLLLLERDELTAGSTWHAAGNCPNFSTSWSLMRLQRYSTRLYATLSGTVDYPIGYHVTGSIRLAQTRARMDEYRHVAAMAQHQGIDFAVLAPAELKALYPFLELHDLEGGLWDPEDGDIDPAQLTQAFAKGARDRGARIVRGCRVTGLRQRVNGEWQVATERGTVTAEIVVNAAGYRAAEVAALVGRDLPCVAMEHQYLVTEAIPELAARPGKLPLLRVSPAGELGWELHLPVEALLATYDLLWEAERDLGLADFGLYAMDSLRLEKGHPSWKQDLVGDCSPLAASLDRFVALDKPDFIGRAALLAEAQRVAREPMYDPANGRARM